MSAVEAALTGYDACFYCAGISSVGMSEAAYTVVSYDTPIAQLIPVRERSALRVRNPARSAPPLNRVRVPKRAKLNVDVVEILLEERQGHR